MNEKKYNQWLKDVLSRWEGILFGVADISSIIDTFKITPGDMVHKMSSAVSLAMPLSWPVLAGIQDKPTSIYKHHYRVVNFHLDRIGLVLASLIQGKGYLSLPVPASLYIRPQVHEGHLSHRKVAELAGLGWRGKNNLLITPEYGCGVRIITVLTDMPMDMKPSYPYTEGCGECTRCREACPANAIGDAPEDFDRDRCFALVEEFRKRVTGLSICGICIRACMEKYIGK